MSSQGGGVNLDASNIKLIGAISLLLKDSAYDLDRCVAESLSKFSIYLADDDLSGVKVVDDIYQELLYVSYCLSEIVSAVVYGKSCNAVSLLDNCKVERVREKMIIIMKSRGGDQ